MNTPNDLQSNNGNYMSNMMQKLGPLLGLFILVVIVSVLNPSFLEPLNILNLLRQVAINALIAFGMTFVILTGGIDLSVGSILALSSALMAGMIVSGVDPILAILIGCLLGAAMGAVNGLLITKGKMAAEYVVKTLGENAKVAELEGVPGASATRERGSGFHNIADEQLDVVAKQSADFDRTKGLTVMENVLQGNPDIQAVFAHNDEMALGAIEAITSSGKDIAVIGFDGNEDALKAVESGVLTATVAQQPELIGELAVKAAKDVLQGKKIEEKISAPLKLVTKE
nr:substrate-binding domain-containing protein [Priestia flexa]WEZ08028.1 substrate-binding domain-containing protein [Priestia flexa]